MGGREKGKGKGQRKKSARWYEIGNSLGVKGCRDTLLQRMDFPEGRSFKYVP